MFQPADIGPRPPVGWSTVNGGGRRCRRRGGRTDIERALARGNLGCPVRRAGRGRRRRNGRRHSAWGTALDLLWNCSPIADNLIEPAVEPRQCFRYAVRRALVRAGAPARVQLGNAFELARKVVETFVDGSEVVADRVLVVVIVSV
jgi:hypothetical protein